MAIEFQSNPSSSFFENYTIKLMFDCTGFYGMTPSVVSSDPRFVPLNYNVPNNYFQFYMNYSLETSPQYPGVNFNNVLLSSFNLNPPIQGGVFNPPITYPNNYGLWWSLAQTTVDGNVYPLFTVGAEKNSAATLAKLPDLVLFQLLMNFDPRANPQYPT